MNELVFKGNNNQPVTTSLKVAEVFEKNHSGVVRAIENLMGKGVENQCDANLDTHSMFLEYTEDVPQPNGGFKPAKRYYMNRDGFTLLAMGFTGKRALKFKMDYIAAFNNMERELKEQSQPKQMTMAEMFAMQANINLDYERRMLSVENRLNEMEKEREENAKALLQANISEEKTPEMTMRANIRQLVNQYANAKNIRHNDVWHKVYQQLYYLYHISINAYKRGKGESKLDIAEKNHFLDKIYNVISNMVRELK